MDFKNIDWNKAVEQTLADYEKTKNTSTYEKREVDLTKYFTLALGDNENSGTKTFRILPLDTDGKWYDIVKFHNLKVGKNYLKLYDPAQDGEESPLNDMFKVYSESSIQEDKNLANNYRSRDFYIVRGIERGKEHEGVKFWRFPKAYDGSGVMDKIQPMMKFLNDRNPGSGAFFNPIAGRDLVISLIKDSSKGKKKYTKVSQIMFEEPAAVSSDENLMNTWLNDSQTWRDVYRKKPLEYLKIVAQGAEPVWDNELKTFVAKVDIVQGYNSNIQNQELPTQNVDDEVFNYESPTELGESITINTDDLPF